MENNYSSNQNFDVNYNNSEICQKDEINNKINYSVDINLPSKVKRESKLEEVLLEHFQSQMKNDKQRTKPRDFSEIDSLIFGDFELGQ